MDPNDVDFKIFDSTGKHIAYAIVEHGERGIHTSYPLIVSSKRLIKLMDKRYRGVVIWACSDGIIYSKIDTLRGEIAWGANSEFICSFSKSKDIKYVRY